MIAAALSIVLWTGGCAEPPLRSAPRTTLPGSADVRSIGPTAARVARSMVGTPYRHGGDTPAGFDCSGLVRYSFARAGLAGLPHSVRALARLAHPVPIDSIHAGDLLFFSGAWLKKKSHVGIYLGNRRFVHAPSSGKSVEVVSFDDVYWGPRVHEAGRLTP